MSASTAHIYDRAELVRRMSEGLSPPFLHFWGHTGQGVGNWVLSQWYPAPFLVDGVRYATAEHWMMSEKAKLFGDTATRAKILSIDDPAAAKKLGREVAGYDDAAWRARRVDAVREGSVHKFRQNQAMGELLLSTRGKVLVEAAPRDTVWGIGLGAANPNASVPSRWRGENLLGFAPMWARDQLAAEASR